MKFIHLKLSLLLYIDKSIQTEESYPALTESPSGQHLFCDFVHPTECKFGKVIAVDYPFLLCTCNQTSLHNVFLFLLLVVLQSGFSATLFVYIHLRLSFTDSMSEMAKRKFQRSEHVMWKTKQRWLKARIRYVSLDNPKLNLMNALVYSRVL